MSSEETKLAVMQEQVNYIKKTVDDIVSKLDTATANHQLQMDRLQTEIDRRFEGVHKRMDDETKKLEDKKADKTEVEKINGVISRLAWFIILAVLGAILTLTLK
jgi:hypothetical protein